MGNVHVCQILFLHLKTGNVHAHPHILPKGRLSLINVATAMLCSSSLVIRKGICLLRLAQKQEKKVKMNAVV